MRTNHLFTVKVLAACMLGGGVSSQSHAQVGPLSVQQKSAVQLTLSWPAAAGKTYEVWSTPALSSAWIRLTNGLSAPGGSVRFDVGISNNAGFYRVAEVASGTGPDPARFAWIAPGSFLMGSPDTEVGRDTVEGPQTAVSLTKGYWMSRYEVTQAEFLAVVGRNPSRNTNDLSNPVERVSWRDATNYCALRTQSEQAASRLPAGYVYRLPTEAEWEYACRAGTTTRFSYGDDLDFSQLGLYAWYEANASFKTHPVGLLQANPWQLYDVSGNVLEWCWDWYFGLLPGGNVTDPTGPSSGSQHVLKGGSCYSPGEACRSAYRGSAIPNYTDSTLGFRPVVAAPL